MARVWLIRLSLSVLILALSIENGFAAEPYSHGEPSDLEQLLLERINTTRANPGPVAQRLGVRLSDTSARQPLVFHEALLEASEGHSNYMIAHNEFSHVGAGGTNEYQRMDAAGYPFGGGYEGWAENLGLHETVGHTEESVLHVTQDLLFKSAAHREWLLQPFFRETGLGVVFGTTKVRGARREVIVVTESFAASGASPSPETDGSFLQGVVYDDANANGRYDLGEGLEGVTVTPNVGSTFYGVTSSSGGYALPMANHHGSVTLTFESDSFSHTNTLIMTIGVNAKADLRLQDVPEAIVVEPPVAIDPTPIAFPNLQIKTTPEGRLSVNLPEGVAMPAVLTLLHSTDLREWSPVTMEAGSVVLPALAPSQGYYRWAETSE